MFIYISMSTTVLVNGSGLANPSLSLKAPHIAPRVINAVCPELSGRVLG